nr:MAG TPA: hypothetical protein [Caudoviricetes sp.]
MSAIRTEIVADDSQVERTLKKVENQAKKTGRAVDRATGSAKTPAAGAQLQGGLKAGGLGSMAGRVGDLAGLGGVGALGIAAGAVGVVIQGVTTALEYMRQEVANTAETLANNVKELQQTFNDQKARHKTELDALKQLRELNNAGDSDARAVLQQQALQTLTRTHKGLPMGLDENGNITNLDEAERIVMEKQNQELQDNLKQQLKSLNEQQKLWAEVRESSLIKSDVAQSGVEIQKISEQRVAIAKQLRELKKLNYADLQKEREARQQLKSDQFYENEVKLQKQQLHLQSLKNKGLDEEYARQKAIYDIQNRGLKVNEEAIRRQIALQRANADEKFKGDQNKRAEDLKFQAEQKLRTPEQQAIAAALRAAEAAKRASGGGSLTKPERQREEQIARLNYRLNNLTQLNLGDISTKTNALTARGGFASGIVRPQGDRVNYQIMANTQATNRLIQSVLGEIQKLGRI